MTLVNVAKELFFMSVRNPVTGSIITAGGVSQFVVVGYRLSFDDDREPEVLEGTEIYIEHQTQCLHPILPGTQQETLYFEVLGCPVVGLTCQKSTWKGVFGPFKDVVKLGDFDIGKHEFVYEAKQVPDSMKARGHFKMHVRFVDGAGKLLWQHKRRFKIWNKSETGQAIMLMLAIIATTSPTISDNDFGHIFMAQTAVYRNQTSSWTNRILNAKDHASVQISVADVDPTTGKSNGTTSTFALAGFLRRIGEADEALVSLISKSDEQR